MPQMSCLPRRQPVLYDITDDYSLGVAESFKAEAEANGLRS